MDIRVYSHPPDFKILSEPGMYTGWTLTIELDTGTSSIIIPRDSDARHVADLLEQLARKVDKGRA